MAVVETIYYLETLYVIPGKDVCLPTRENAEFKGFGEFPPDVYDTAMVAVRAAGDANFAAQAPKTIYWALRAKYPCIKNKP